MFYVYKYTCPNNKVYIGITHNTEQRIGLNGSGYKNQYFGKEISKHGWDWKQDIKKEILYTCFSLEQAEDLEKKEIIKHKSNNYKFGYNRSTGGEYPSLINGDSNSNNKNNKSDNELYNEEQKALLYDLCNKVLIPKFNDYFKENNREDLTIYIMVYPAEKQNRIVLFLKKNGYNVTNISVLIPEQLTVKGVYDRIKTKIKNYDNFTKKYKLGNLLLKMIERKFNND